MSKDTQVSLTATEDGGERKKEESSPVSETSPTKATAPAVADSSPTSTLPAPGGGDDSLVVGTPKAGHSNDTVPDSMSTSSSLSSSPITYFTAKKTPFYIQAKTKMQDGDFEAALTMIEKGITSILSSLPNKNDQNEMHESVAPLHYLYGTTLLYSIEESQDNPENSLISAQAQAEQEHNGNGESADAAGDLQIAWENLETARSIITNMQCKGNYGNESTLTESEQKELTTDLAQIHCRLGDLSRHDGHYEQAISDYEICCKSRRDILKGDDVWSRKIADVEYNLGVTCLSMAAEGEKKLLDEFNNETNAPKSTANAAVAAIQLQAAPPQDTNSSSNITPEQISALRDKSFKHYTQCCRILAGMIAMMCGGNPSEIVAVDDNLNIDYDGDKKCPAKTSEIVKGLDEETVTSERTIHDQAAAAIVLIRARVSKLQPTNVKDAENVHDLREMLDEIQENIDNSETDREGLRDLGMMRKKAEEEANKNNPGADEKEGSSETQLGAGTTTIGFGKDQEILKSDRTFSASASASTVGTTAAPLTPASAAPMMVVKKKKKKRHDNQSAGNVDAKRVKTG